MIGTKWNPLLDCFCHPRCQHMEFSKRKLFFLIIGFSGIILIILANFIGPYSSNRVYILAANFHNNNLSHLTAFNMNISIVSENSMYQPSAVNNLNNSWLFGRVNNDMNIHKTNSVNNKHVNIHESNSVNNVRKIQNSLIDNISLNRDRNEAIVESTYDSNDTVTGVADKGEVILDDEDTDVYDDENTLEFESERYYADDELGESTTDPTTISVVHEKSNERKVKNVISARKKNRNYVSDQTRADAGKDLANVASMFIENQPENVPVEIKPIKTEVKQNYENLKKNMHNSERFIPLDNGLKTPYGKQHLNKKNVLDDHNHEQTNIQGNGKLSNGQQNYRKDVLVDHNHEHTNVRNNGKLSKVLLDENGIKRPASTMEKNYGRQSKDLLNEVGIRRADPTMEKNYDRQSKVLLSEVGIKRADSTMERMSAREKTSNVESIMQAVGTGDRFVGESDTVHSGSKVSRNKQIESTIADTTVGFLKDPNCQSRPTMTEDILCLKRPKFLSDYRNPCWMEGDVLRCLPYFYIMGVCKTGSTDLFERLSHHPQVVKNHGLLGKETWYWTWNRYGHSNFYRSYRELMSFNEFIDKFDAYNIESITKRQPNGTLYHPGVTGHGDPMDFWDHSSWQMIPQNDPSWNEPNITTPSLVKHVNPNVKLILLLRDPVERLFSNYLHGKFGETADQFHDDVLRSLSLLSSCRESQSMKSCLYDSQIIQELTVPISGSFYSIHLQEWLKVFPRKQIFIIRTEDFSTNVANTLLRIFRFLKLDPIPTRDLYRIANMPHFYDTKAKQTAGEIQSETREILETLFEPYNSELAKMLNDENFNFNTS